MSGVFSAVYGTMQYEEPLKSFNKSRELFRRRASWREFVMIAQKST